MEIKTTMNLDKIFKEFSDGIEHEIITIIAKLDNGSHSSNQLQGADEELSQLFFLRKEKLKASLQTLLASHEIRGEEKVSDCCGASYNVSKSMRKGTRIFCNKCGKQCSAKEPHP